MLFNVVTGISTIFIAITAFLLIRSGKKNLSKLLLGEVFLSICFWGITTFINSTVRNYSIVIMSTKLSYVAGICLLYTFSLFMKSLYCKRIRFQNLDLIITIIVSVFAVTTKYIVSDIIWNESEGSFPRLGKFFLFYAFATIFILVKVVINLMIAFYKTSAQQLLRLKYMIFGMFISGFLIVTTNIILPLFHNDVWIQFGFIWILPTIFFSTYSFLYEKLFDIKYIFGQFLLNFIFVIIIFVVYNLVTYLQISLWGNIFNLNAYTLGFLISIAFVYLSRFMVKRITEKINKNLIFATYDPDEVIAYLQEELDKTIKLEEIQEIIRLSIKKVIPVKNVKYIFYGDNKKRLKAEFGIGNKSYDYIPITEIRGKEQRESFEKYNLSGIGFFSRGLILIERSKKDFAYTINNLTVLKKIVSFANTAFDRAFLYNQIQDFNNILKSKIKEQTSELRDKIKKLQEMRQHEKDMIDIMGHELRTPLTIIKNAVSIIDYVKRNNPEDVKWSPIVGEQYKNISEALQREIRLVETMLSATKLDADKLALSITDVNLVDVLNQTVLAFKSQAEDKGLRLDVVYDKKKKWMVKADTIRLQEIIDNLVSNAVKYTQKGFILLELNSVDNMVKVSVIDTGEGISKQDIKNLGKKFFRANQYIESGKNNVKRIVRPGGSGLGLYVTFGLVKIMGGKMEVQSELGKGSTFSFTIPKA